MPSVFPYLHATRDLDEGLGTRLSHTLMLVLHVLIYVYAYQHHAVNISTPCAMVVSTDTCTLMLWL